MHSSTNEPSEGAALVVSGVRICSISDCRSTAISRGWCNKHYKRWRKTGDPLSTKKCEWISRDEAGRPSCIHGPANSGGGGTWRCRKKKKLANKKGYDNDADSRGKTKSRLRGRRALGWYEEDGMATKPLRVKELT